MLGRTVGRREAQVLFVGVDTWSCDGSAWAQRTEPGPVGRTGAAVAAIVSK
jgi:hypothetical protein